MKEIIYKDNGEKVEVLAIVKGGTGHDMAECISYAKHGNAVYGLYRMGVSKLTDFLCMSDREREGYNDFMAN